MAMLAGSSGTCGSSGCTLAGIVGARSQKEEPGTGWAGNRWEAAEDVRPSCKGQTGRRQRHLDQDRRSELGQLRRRLLALAAGARPPQIACELALPPSCELSTPCESP
jgi:hypothetical protein